MCGSLRLERQMNSIRVRGQIPGDYIEGAGDLHRDSFHWNGWARIDGSRDGAKTFADQWPTERNRVVTIKDVEHFTERSRSTGRQVRFNAEGRQIAAIIDHRGEIRILTRQARTEEEKKIHSRMPVTVRDNRGRDGFVEYMNEKLDVEYD